MRIGFCNGCFDLFHDGHYFFLATAKEHCDYLIVALNSDYSVTQLKGLSRPRQPWLERLNSIIETDLVEAVIPYDGFEQGLITRIKPDVVVRGYDQGIDTTQIAKGLGCELVHVPKLEGFSTSLQIQAAAAKTNA